MALETADDCAQYIAGEDLELTGFSVRQRDSLVARLKARDAAVARAFAADVLALYRSSDDISWESILDDLAEIAVKYGAAKEPG